MRSPILKEEWEILEMREAGRIVAEGHRLLREAIRPGISTKELDGIYEKHVRSRGAEPTFLGYKGFPASICASINEEVVHGIPSADRVLREGDIISVDCGATYKNYVGDAAFTTGVGTISEEAERLIRVTRECLQKAIEAMGPGARLKAIGEAVQDHAEANGYAVVKQYVGHGIGQKMHEEPQVPNYARPATEYLKYEMKPGIVLAVEPMLNTGSDEVRTLEDRWTVVTRDGKLSAHEEHTIAVTKDGREILTLP